MMMSQPFSSSFRQIIGVILLKMFLGNFNFGQELLVYFHSCPKTHFESIKFFKAEKLIKFKKYKFSNPNGSVEHIAGVYNDKKNVMGMMPHPERAFEDFHVTKDGYKLLDNFMELI